jgi:hypothetical protein
VEREQIEEAMMTLEKLARDRGGRRECPPAKHGYKGAITFFLAPGL